MIRKPQGCTQPLDLKKDETVNHDLNETLFLIPRAGHRIIDF